MTATVGCGPTWVVDGPPPQAPLYTLLGASRVIDDVDEGQVERWANGVKVYAYPSQGATVWDAMLSGSDRAEKTFGGTQEIPTFGAMVVFVGEVCSSYGIWGQGMSEEDAQARFVARASKTLSAVESASVERELLAGGVLGANAHLADGNGTFPAGSTATGIVNAIAVLENEIAQTGRAGVIHLSPAAAVHASARNLLVRDDRGPAGSPVLRTVANGTIVVPGAGYALANSHPAGKSAPGANQEWIYATGPLEVRRSSSFLVPETVAEALDRRNNQISYLVERYYVVDWDTVLQAAVLADRCSDSC